jgi:hypothetical protein
MTLRVSSITALALCLAPSCGLQNKNLAESKSVVDVASSSTTSVYVFTTRKYKENDHVTRYRCDGATNEEALKKAKSPDFQLICKMDTGGFGEIEVKYFSKTVADAFLESLVGTKNRLIQDVAKLNGDLVNAASTKTQLLQEQAALQTGTNKGTLTSARLENLRKALAFFTDSANKDIWPKDVETQRQQTQVEIEQELEALYNSNETFRTRRLTQIATELQRIEFADGQIRAEISKKETSLEKLKQLSPTTAELTNKVARLITAPVVFDPSVKESLGAIDRLPLSLLRLFFERGFQTMFQGTVTCGRQVYYPKYNNPEGYRGVRQNLQPVSYTYNSDIYSATKQSLLAPSPGLAYNFQAMAQAAEEEAKPRYCGKGYFEIEKVIGHSESYIPGGYPGSGGYVVEPFTVKTRVFYECESRCMEPVIVQAPGYPKRTTSISELAKHFEIEVNKYLAE